MQQSSIHSLNAMYPFQNKNVRLEQFCCNYFFSAFSFSRPGSLQIMEQIVPKGAWDGIMLSTGCSKQQQQPYNYC